MTGMTLDHDRGEQLALLGLGPAHGTASTVELRLLNWNVQHAAPARARRQVAWLAGRPEADVAVLTEVKDSPGGDDLVQALTDSYSNPQELQVRITRLTEAAGWVS